MDGPATRRSAWISSARRPGRDNDRRQDAAAAGSMLGADAAYDGLPYFFSAQFGMAFEYVGRGNPTDDVVIRSKSEDGALGDGFAAFWTCDGVVQAGMTVNAWGASETVERLSSVPASRSTPTGSPTPTYRSARSADTRPLPRPQRSSWIGPPSRLDVYSNIPPLWGIRYVSW